VTKQQLVEMLNEDWLPYITVVRLPEELKRLDARAAQVEVLDADDFPAAALATLLSPAILLTHNFKDFAPLGVRGWAQGTDAVLAATVINDGEMTFQGMLIVPAAPIVAVGAGAKWVADKVGAAGWLLVAPIPRLYKSGLGCSDCTFSHYASCRSHRPSPCLRSNAAATLLGSCSGKRVSHGSR